MAVALERGGVGSALEDRAKANQHREGAGLGEVAILRWIDQRDGDLLAVAIAVEGTADSKSRLSDGLWSVKDVGIALGEWGKRHLAKAEKTSPANAVQPARPAAN